MDNKWIDAFEALMRDVQFVCRLGGSDLVMSQMRARKEAFDAAGGTHKLHEARRLLTAHADASNKMIADTRNNALILIEAATQIKSMLDLTPYGVARGIVRHADVIIDVAGEVFTGGYAGECEACDCAIGNDEAVHGGEDETIMCPSCVKAAQEIDPGIAIDCTDPHMKTVGLGPQIRDPKDSLSAFTVLKNRFAPEDKPLGEPKMKFEDTFSAQDVVMKEFFPKAMEGGSASVSPKATADISAETDPKTGRPLYTNPD